MLDLSHPRTVLPLPAHLRTAPGAGAEAANGASNGTRASRPAIQLKLSEDVLAHLVELARKGHSGGMRIALGDAPAFVVNGVSYPLNLSSEPAHSELVRVASSSRDLEPIAHVSHKASLKPGFNKGALEKVSQSLRGNREIAEREREGKSFRIGKGTVPASLSMSRGNSSEGKADDSHPQQHDSGASTGPAPSPATSVSTPPSPAVSAVDARLKPAPGASASPPAARQASSSSSSTSSSGSSSVHQSSSTFTSQSSGRSPLIVPSAPPKPDLPPPPHKPSSVAAAAGAAVARGGVMKGKETLKKEKKKEERAKGRTVSTPIITASDDEEEEPLTQTTLAPPPSSKKPQSGSPKATHEASLAALPKSPVSAATQLPGALPKSVQLPSFTKRASTTDLRDESEAAAAANKKRRKLLGGAGDDDSGSRSRAPTPGGSPRQSSSGMHKSTSSASLSSANGPKKRARKEERWYSSSDEDEDDREPGRLSAPGSKDLDRDKKRRRSSIGNGGAGAAASGRSGSEAEDGAASTSRGRPATRVPSHLQPVDPKHKTGSPLRPSIVVVSRPIATPTPPPPPPTGSTSSADAHPPSKKSTVAPPPATTPASEYHIADAATYEVYKTRFEDAYGPYADLHKRLVRERDECVAGGREEFDVDEVDKLVKRIGKERAALAGIQDAIADWARRTSR
ncbi:hypothetical protein RQP46_004895 [Phenoliferia psychrophenolica]